MKLWRQIATLCGERLHIVCLRLVYWHCSMFLYLFVVKKCHQNFHNLFHRLVFLFNKPKTRQNGYRIGKNGCEILFWLWNSILIVLRNTTNCSWNGDRNNLSKLRVYIWSSAILHVMTASCHSYLRICIYLFIFLDSKLKRKNIAQTIYI